MLYANIEVVDSFAYLESIVANSFFKGFFLVSCCRTSCFGVVVFLNPLKTRDPLTGTFANREDPDKMTQGAAFHQGLHCFQRLNRSSEIRFYFWKL